MSLKVGELRKVIAHAPDDASVMLIHEGVMGYAIGIDIAPNGAVAIIRSRGNPRQSKHFSVAEDGVIGGLNAMGLSDESIAKLMERSVDSIKRRMKSIGLK